MPYTTSDGIRIAYDDLGSGETALLLMPGWCGTRAAFNRVAPLLARPHRVLAMDWRGHGGSGAAAGDFGEKELLDDALAVVRASGAKRVVPVATAHAGWVALALRQALGARVPQIVLLDWIVTEAPPPFLAALAAMQDPAKVEATLAQVFAMWRDGTQTPDVEAFLQVMASFGPAMWARAGREIAASYAKEGSPLAALARLRDAPPVLHAYAQPRDAGFLALQEAYAREHPFYRAKVLPGRTHFPTIETPEATAEAIEAFLARPLTAPP
ncbi:MAG: hypothetical protein QOE90_403 [Thermoplasmata archaeon]|jgi:pimeloyl-ACP methyl ester carboxylesterase|nr:hypothetical protein [Thermoplasmata archaeon]